MSAKKGVSVYGKQALNAIITEYEQLENLSVFTPIHVKTLSPESRKGALQAINLIKEKRTGKLKGCTVADGRKQRSLYDKHEISSPALSRDGFLGDAHENCHIAIADIDGTFLKANQDDYVLVKFKGPAVKDLLRINEKKNKKFVVHEKNTKVIYVRLLKAMYGTLTAPILWYHLFADTLLEDKFVINPYEPCIANKTVNGPVCWYVDTLKVSHVDEEAVQQMMEKLKTKFGKMNITYGPKQEYLGMDLDIKTGSVHISMKLYLEEAIKTLYRTHKLSCKNSRHKNPS